MKHDPFSISELLPIEDALERFVKSEETSVLAIKGDWGAGKTYFVTRFFQRNEALGDQQISFVSLFGISTLEDLKRQIIPSAISLRQFREGDKVNRVQAILGMARKLPKISQFNAFIESLENFAIHNLILVIDDIERKANELSLKNVLGLVNYLSEHASCKVILILNEDQLSDVDKLELAKFREKLIDQELLFAPSFETNAKIFFEDTKLFNRALEIFKQCDCRNLRVIQRCYIATKEFRSQFEGLSLSGISKLLDQVLLLSCLFYRFGGQIDFEALLASATLYGPPVTKEKIRGADILKKVTYRPSDADALILHYLRTGLFDPNMTQAHLDRDLQMSRQHVTWAEMEQIFAVFNGNFQGTLEEFIGKLTDFFLRNVNLLGWSAFSQGIEALEATGNQGEAQRWRDEFVKRHAHTFTFSDCKAFEQLPLTGEAKNTIASRKNAILTARHPKEIMWTIVSQHAWNPEDVEALDQHDSRFYEQWFASDQDSALLPLLREFLQSFNPECVESVSRSVGGKIYSALGRLAKDPFLRLKIVNVLGIPAEILSADVKKSRARNRRGNRKRDAKGRRANF